MIELAGIVILGVMAQWLAWKMKIPAILPLILIGLFVGPISTLITEDGSKWIEPIWNGTSGIFPGERLFNFVSLAISIILFEGGMTLKKEEIKDVGPVIYRLITLGSLTTFAIAGIAAHLIIGLSWPISLLFSALIIVTGPTVITPILRNLAIKKEISTILKWEGILIDPIGALAAVLVFEFISVGNIHGSGGYTQEALIEFGKIIIIGFSIGFTAAYAFAAALKNKFIPPYLINVVALAIVLLVFVLSDLFAHESGLLAVVVMGMVLGNMNIPVLKEVLYFKEALSILLISLLFILLSANINIADLQLIYNIESLFLFLAVIFIRPIAVLLSARKSNLAFNEKLFVSWVGPRGIVAAGIASLFGLKLTMQGIEGAEYITPLVFMIVLGTVLLNATTAKIFAKISGILLIKSEGILVVGASPPARLIAKYLQDSGKRVVLIDSNPKAISIAKKEGLEAIVCDIFSDALMENIELNDIGILIALTGSSRINEYALSKLGSVFGKQGTYRLINIEEMNNSNNNPEEGLFSLTDDYINFSEVVRDFPYINEVAISSQEHYVKILEATQQDVKTIPLFIKDKKGEVHVISSFSEKIEKGYMLMYLGKKLENK